MAAQRQGVIDGKEWAEKRAHPSELSRVGLQYEINKRQGYGTAFRPRGRRPGHEEFVRLIRPDLDDEKLRDEARAFWGDRLEVINGFGRFGAHYIKEFADAAVCIWLAMKESWEAVAYVRGVEAGKLWSKTWASPEELARLRDENQRHSYIHGAKIYSPDLDDPYRIAEIILDPEPCDDDDEPDPDFARRLKMKFWGPIIGDPYESNSHRIDERRFVLGFVAGALGKEEAIWAKF
jgi:hypothetical protein